MDTFADRFRLLRNEANLSQAQLADLLELGKAAIGHYETGYRQPSLSILEQLATLFDVSTDFLLGRTSNRGVATEDIHNIEDLKRYLGMDTRGLIRLLLCGERNDDRVPKEAVIYVLEAIEFARWKYGIHPACCNQPDKACGE